jgi:hypothetical protein
MKRSFGREIQPESFESGCFGRLSRIANPGLPHPIDEAIDRT